MEDVAQQHQGAFRRYRELLCAPSIPDPTATAATGTSTGSNICQLRSQFVGTATETESLCKCLSSGQTPSQGAIVSALTSFAGAITGLALHACDQQQQMSELQPQMSGRQQQISELQQQISELQQQFRSLEGDSDTLLVRQMATQAINKLARIVDPELSAYEARDMSMLAVAEMAKDMGDNNAKYQDILKRHNKFNTGMRILCDMGRLVAHPIPQPAVTEEQLRAAINTQVAPRLRAHAEDVLMGLVELASVLGEPLFVPTERSHGSP